MSGVANQRNFAACQQLRGPNLEQFVLDDAGRVSVRDELRHRFGPVRKMRKTLAALRTRESVGAVARQRENPELPSNPPYLSDKIRRWTIDDPAPSGHASPFHGSLAVPDLLSHNTVHTVRGNDKVVSSGITVGDYLGAAVISAAHTRHPGSGA